MATPHLSVVVPACDEQETIGDSLDRLCAALATSTNSWEVLVVDDGSIDDTAAIMEGRIADQPNLRLIRLSRNFGKEGAQAAGLSLARGRYVAVIDADLQDPPEVLLEMLAQAEAGYDVVYGVRRSRRGGLLKRIGYSLYYRLLKLVSEPVVPLDSGDFSVMSRRVVDEINRLPERGRFLRALRSWVGFRQIGHPYDRLERRYGRSKYSFLRLLDLAATGLLSSTRLPLKLSIHLGVLLAGLGFLWALKVFVWRIWFDTAPQGFATIIIAVLVVGGVQLVALGVIGSYLGRVLDQGERRPHFIIDRTANCPADEREQDGPEAEDPARS